MKTYADALEWIETKSKEYGGKNKFLCSDEYRAKYCEIQALHKSASTDVTNRAQKAMCEAQVKEGQRVYYDLVGSWGHVDPQEGIIILDKKGMPKVKLDSGKTVKWHKGFKPV